MFYISFLYLIPYVNEISCFRDIANCVSKNMPFELQPEDGFMKKAETCHCYNF